MIIILSRGKLLPHPLGEHNFFTPKTLTYGLQLLKSNEIKKDALITTIVLLEMGLAS